MNTELPVSPVTPVVPKKSGIIYILVLLCFSFAATSFFFFWKSTQFFQEPTASIADKKAVLNTTLSLPKDAIKLSGCVPYMGEHWAETKNIPTGPYYLIYNNKVLGIEYMFTESEVKGDRVAEKSPAEVGKYMATKNLTFAGLLKSLEMSFPIPAASFKEWTISWTPPHAALVASHYDVHMYLIDKKERDTICPDATAEGALPPDLYNELQKRGIAVPHSEAPAPSKTTTTVTPKQIINNN